MMHERFQRAGSSFLRLPLVMFLLFGSSLAPVIAAQGPDDKEREAAFFTDVAPLLTRYCHDCHAGDTTEADIDFAAMFEDQDVPRQVAVWVRVREVLDTRQMPPPEADQPRDSESARLLSAVQQMLRRQAEAHAGDPGPVVLRRLTNAEYNHSVHDLTGVDTLNPTREFPVDGAAGEGFTNVGSAQSMSPALVGKYLEAARSVAAHTVLLPESIGFSPDTSRRDRTDALLAKIQTFYRRFTDDDGSSPVNLQGIEIDTNAGGRLPLKEYLNTIREHRDAIHDGSSSLSQIAAAHHLSARYLQSLWAVLETDAARESLFLRELRIRWNRDIQQNEDSTTAWIASAQNALWKFNTVGQIGREGGPSSWLEAILRLEPRREFRVPLNSGNSSQPADLWLAAHDLGDGNLTDFVLWERARVEFSPESLQPPVLLRDADRIAHATRTKQGTELARTAEYLAALVKLHKSPAAASSPDQSSAGHTLDAGLLRRWSQLTGIGGGAEPTIAGHFTQRVTAVAGYSDVNGWGLNGIPSLLTNRANEEIRFQTLGVPARGVTVHPSPELEAWAAWRAPENQTVQITALAADADDVCGNGAAWRVDLLTGFGRQILKEGTIENGGRSKISISEPVPVRRGDVIRLNIGPRDRNHVCDTTQIELTVTSVDDSARTWTLSEEIVDRVLEDNPLTDRHGHQAVWHFGSQATGAEPTNRVPPNSALADWVQAVRAGAHDKELRTLAMRVQRIATDGVADELSAADGELRRELLTWTGPLNWLKSGRQDVETVPADDTGLAFGVGPEGTAVAADSFVIRAPAVTPIEIPGELCGAAEFVVTGRLLLADPDASVQLHVLRSQPESPPLNPADPITATTDSPAAARLTAELAAFRDLFPPALCYERIVPVDEVVTLQLFYREDDQLQRLMLTDDEIQKIDRLWDELLYVSQEPIALTVAYEQIAEFATQDRPDLVEALAPLREPINQRAAGFRERLLSDEPKQLQSVLEFADRAWRRPLTESEQNGIRVLYRDLRNSGMAHDETIRMLITRVLSSPSFLYRREDSPANVAAGPVTDHELATRLSYFLWSSIPDAPLRAAAASGQLTAPPSNAGLDSEPDNAALSNELQSQLHRMLADERTRRLAEQFACQWLHVRDFDEHDDKNEQLYPEFAELRSDMYEETVLFFEDVFRNNGSITDLLTARHTWLNNSLAAHYGIDGVEGSHWRRVGGIDEFDRGGILGMSTILASQSGASRTSPILRGNWISETLLGERLPRPPANVPQLPDSVPEGLTERELIEQHSSVPECARCHARIDPYGFALEQFDTIGRRRETPVDTRTTLPDGTDVDGLAGLRNYLATERRDAFVAQFCRKLLGYALGREVLLSDEPLLEDMQRALEENDYRFHTAVEMIVGSPQFRQIRGTGWRDD